MTTVFDTSFFDEIDEKRKALEQEMREKGQEELKKLFAEVFEAVPNLHKIRWTQYTPYFNDGDPCVFSVNEPMFLLSDISMSDVRYFCDDEYDDDRPEDSHWVEAWCLYNLEDDLSVEPEERKRWDGSTYYHRQQKRVYKKDYLEILHKVSNLITRNTDLMLFCFGDHVEVKVNKDLTVIQVNEYYHD